MKSSFSLAMRVAVSWILSESTVFLSEVSENCTDSQCTKLTHLNYKIVHSLGTYLTVIYSITLDLLA